MPNNKQSVTDSASARLTATLVATCLLLTGCGGGGGSANDSLESALQGEWSNCFRDTSESIEITVSGTNFVAIGRSWDSPNCSGQAVDDSTLSGRYFTGGAVTTDGGLSALEFDLLVERVEEDGEVLSPNETILSIIRVEDERFFLGECRDESDECGVSQRPTSLDFDAPYLKH